MAFAQKCSSSLLRFCLLFFLLASILQVSHQTDPDHEIKYNYFPFFLIYKSGHVQRFLPASAFVPAGIDPTTGVTSKDVTIDSKTNVSARLYLPKLTNTTQDNKKLPVVVFYHGGAFCFKSAFDPQYHVVLNLITSQSNIVAVSVNYRLAPEHLLPAAYHDSWAALKWIFSSKADAWIQEHGDFNRVFIAGDSAGANIAHNLVMRAGRENGVKIEGMILICPYFWGSKPLAGEPKDPKKWAFFPNIWTMVNKDGVGLDDPRINPMEEGAPSLARLGCKMVMVCIAGDDPLRFRGKEYYEALKASGYRGKVELVVSKGEGHVFILQQPRSVKSLELMKRFTAFFKLK